MYVHTVHAEEKRSQEVSSKLPQKLAEQARVRARTSVADVQPLNPHAYDDYQVNLDDIRVYTVATLDDCRSKNKKAHSTIIENFNMQFNLHLFISSTEFNQVDFTKVLVHGSLQNLHIQLNTETVRTLTRIQKSVSAHASLDVDADVEKKKQRSRSANSPNTQLDSPRANSGESSDRDSVSAVPSDGNHSTRGASQAMESSILQFHRSSSVADDIARVYGGVSSSVSIGGLRNLMEVGFTLSNFRLDIISVRKEAIGLKNMPPSAADIGTSTDEQQQQDNTAPVGAHRRGHSGSSSTRSTASGQNVVYRRIECPLISLNANDLHVYYVQNAWGGCSQIRLKSFFVRDLLQPQGSQFMYLATSRPSIQPKRIQRTKGASTSSRSDFTSAATDTSSGGNKEFVSITSRFVFRDSPIFEGVDNFTDVEFYRLSMQWNPETVASLMEFFYPFMAPTELLKASDETVEEGDEFADTSSSEEEEEKTKNTEVENASDEKTEMKSETVLPKTEGMDFLAVPGSPSSMNSSPSHPQTPQSALKQSIGQTEQYVEFKSRVVARMRELSIAFNKETLQKRLFRLDVIDTHFKYEQNIYETSPGKESPAHISPSTPLPGAAFSVAPPHLAPLEHSFGVEGVLGNLSVVDLSSQGQQTEYNELLGLRPRHSRSAKSGSEENDQQQADHLTSFWYTTAAHIHQPFPHFTISDLSRSALCSNVLYDAGKAASRVSYADPQTGDIPTREELRTLQSMFLLNIGWVRLVFLEKITMEIADYFNQGILGAVANDLARFARSELSPEEYTALVNDLKATHLESLRLGNYSRAIIRVDTPLLIIPRSHSSKEYLQLDCSHISIGTSMLRLGECLPCSEPASNENDPNVVVTLPNADASTELQQASVPTSLVTEDTVENEVTVGPGEATIVPPLSLPKEEEADDSDEEEKQQIPKESNAEVKVHRVNLDHSWSPDHIAQKMDIEVSGVRLVSNHREEVVGFETQSDCPNSPPHGAVPFKNIAGDHRSSSPSVEYKRLEQVIFEGVNTTLKVILPVDVTKESEHDLEETEIDPPGGSTPHSNDQDKPLCFILGNVANLHADLSLTQYILLLNVVSENLGSSARRRFRTPSEISSSPDSSPRLVQYRYDDPNARPMSMRYHIVVEEADLCLRRGKLVPLPTGDHLSPKDFDNEHEQQLTDEQRSNILEERRLRTEDRLAKVSLQKLEYLAMNHPVEGGTTSCVAIRSLEVTDMRPAAKHSAFSKLIVPFSEVDKPHSRNRSSTEAKSDDREEVKGGQADDSSDPYMEVRWHDFGGRKRVQMQIDNTCGFFLPSLVTECMDFFDVAHSLADPKAMYFSNVQAAAKAAEYAGKNGSFGSVPASGTQGDGPFDDKYGRDAPDLDLQVDFSKTCLIFLRSKRHEDSPSLVTTWDMRLNYRNLRSSSDDRVQSNQYIWGMDIVTSSLHAYLARANDPFHKGSAKGHTILSPSNLFLSFLIRSKPTGVRVDQTNSEVHLTLETVRALEFMCDPAEIHLSYEDVKLLTSILKRTKDLLAAGQRASSEALLDAVCGLHSGPFAPLYRKYVTMMRRTRPEALKDLHVFEEALAPPASSDATSGHHKPRRHHKRRHQPLLVVNEWVCANCSFPNNYHSNVCDMCDADRDIADDMHDLSPAVSFASGQVSTVSILFCFSCPSKFFFVHPDPKVFICSYSPLIVSSFYSFSFP